MQKQINTHKPKLKKPEDYYLEWNTFPNARQRRELIGWKKEIKAFTEQKDIFEGILKDRKG
jgi:hypothetical protein